MGDAETDNGVETAESKVTSFDLLWPWIVTSYESCRNDRFEFLMTSFDLSSMTFDEPCSVSSSNENSVTELEGSFRISSFLSFHHKLLSFIGYRIGDSDVGDMLSLITLCCWHYVSGSFNFRF